MNRGQILIDDINAYHPTGAEAAVWWIGQHSFIVKLSGTRGEAVVYIDPFLSDLPGRQVPPLLKPSEVTNATLVLGTHDHVDHIDRGALPGIMNASPNATLIVPELLRARVVDDLHLDSGRVLGMDIESPVTVAGLTIDAVPAAHEHLDRDPQTGLHPYLGFIISGTNFCIYHAGDTCIYEGMHAMLRRWRIDLAMLPINGRDAHRLKNDIVGNMTYQEAADLAGNLQFATTIPAHFEMFAMNSVNPQLFIDYVGVKYPRSHTFVPEHGRRTIVKRGKVIPEPV